MPRRQRSRRYVLIRRAVVVVVLGAMAQTLVAWGIALRHGLAIRGPQGPIFIETVFVLEWTPGWISEAARMSPGALMVDFRVAAGGSAGQRIRGTGLVPGIETVPRSIFNEFAYPPETPPPGTIRWTSMGSGWPVYSLYWAEAIKDPGNPFPDGDFPESEDEFLAAIEKSMLAGRWGALDIISKSASKFVFGHTKMAGYPLPLLPIFPGFAINTALYGAVLYILFFAFVDIRRIRRARKGHCLACGYDLTGSSPTPPPPPEGSGGGGGVGGHACPECGMPSR